MTHRIKNLPLFVLLVGGLIFSVCYNFYQAQKIEHLENTIICNTFLDPFDYSKIKEEIMRLEHIKYE